MSFLQYKTRWQRWKHWLFMSMSDNSMSCVSTMYGTSPFPQLGSGTNQEGWTALLKHFFVGWVQLIFVAMTTVFISHQLYVANFISALVVNIIWAFNIKKMVDGTRTHRLVYALGCATGSVSGSLIGGLLL